MDWGFLRNGLTPHISKFKSVRVSINVIWIEYLVSKLQVGYHTNNQV